MKEIANFFDHEEAHIAASFLRAQGLTVHLADVHSLTAMPELRLGKDGFRLMAEERDANVAIRLLADINHEAANKPGCPKCRSKRIAKVGDIRFPLFRVMFTLIDRFAPATGNLRCRDCQHKWHKDHNNQEGAT